MERGSGAVFDLVSFHRGYSAGPCGYHARTTLARLAGILVRLVHYRGIDGKFAFRYGAWVPAQWREFHELYEFARTRGWQRNELAYGAGMFSRPGVCVEQEYLKTLLLMRLDSGNFTPDQVEWVARQLEGWAGSLMLVPPPGSGASFFVDLTGSQGLRRQDKVPSGDRVLLLDAGPIYTQIVERMRWLPERDDEAPRPDEPPPREQRLLLMRLASLYGPDAIAQSPRATRFSTNADVRVVVGLAPLTRAIAEIERLPDNARTPGIAASFDEITDMVTPGVGPETAMRRVRGVIWKMEDRSDTGAGSLHRQGSPAREIPRERGDAWAHGRAPDAAAPGRRDDCGHRIVGRGSCAC